MAMTNPETNMFEKHKVIKYTKLQTELSEDNLKI